MTNLGLAVFLMSFLLVSNGFAGPEEEVGIDEKLSEFIPLDITLNDEKGNALRLDEFFGEKPILLNLVYFNCPGICSPLMNGMVTAIDKMPYGIGQDYEIITVSFDSEEDHVLAAKKQASYFAQLKNQKPDTHAWRFLTGDSTNLKRLVDAVGFKYKVVGEELAHSGALITLSPQGKICRYLYGLEFLPFDLKMALIEAKAGQSHSTITRLLEYCYNYDPQGRTYVIDVTKIVGAVMLLTLAIFFGFLVFFKKTKNITESGNK
jgi:protein SCO1/2